MTFTKLFASITESTVWCESSDIRVVWITMLAMANQNGKVFGSIPGLANRARVSIEVTEEALRKFMGPDPYSRTKDFEGRRIEEIDGGWRLLTYEKHAAYRHEDERRQYMRELMRKRRSVSNPLADVSNVSHGKPPLAHADVDVDADADKESTKSKARALRAFTPPSLDEVSLYCKERNNGIDPEKFIAYYEAVGWRRGPTPIKSWRAAIVTWEKKNYGGEFRGGYQSPSVSKNQQRVINNRAAILVGLGISPMPGQCEPSLQDRDASGGNPDMATRLLKGKS